MKYLITVFLIFIGITAANSQSLEADFGREVRFRKTGMMVLGSWAVVNIAGGLALRSNSVGRERYFHEMNAIWNGVNLGIATLGYISAARLAMPVDAFGLYQEQASLEKVLLFNAGLDLAYIAGGLWMTERAKNVTSNADRWKGYGQAVMLQGAFLFVFDIAMILLQPDIDLSQYPKFSLRPGAPDFLYFAWQF